jgi:hypothetical protein
MAGAQFNNTSLAGITGDALNNALVARAALLLDIAPTAGWTPERLYAAVPQYNTEANRNFWAGVLHTYGDYATRTIFLDILQHWGSYSRRFGSDYDAMVRASAANFGFQPITEESI